MGPFYSTIFHLTEVHNVKNKSVLVHVTSDFAILGEPRKCLLTNLSVHLQRKIIHNLFSRIIYVWIGIYASNGEKGLMLIIYVWMVQSSTSPEYAWCIIGCDLNQFLICMQITSTITVQHIIFQELNMLTFQFRSSAYKPSIDFHHSLN